MLTSVVVGVVRCAARGGAVAQAQDVHLRVSHALEHPRYLFLPPHARLPRHAVATYLGFHRAASVLTSRAASVLTSRASVPAGRSYNDLAQYPVFPWILADYTSEKLDLLDPKTFRDLSKPIGVQTDEKVMRFQERFEMTKEAEPDNPPFHYGTHYSNPGYVLWYLLRLEPYTGAAVSLQGGTFDVPDRMFWSVQDAYQNCTTTLNDVKELVPEFFYLPEFLVNLGKQDFGEPQRRRNIDNVELPPWANGSGLFSRRGVAVACADVARGVGSA
eukprot:433881-Rhodomonas_salina.4